VPVASRVLGENLPDPHIQSDEDLLEYLVQHATQHRFKRDNCPAGWGQIDVGCWQRAAARGASKGFVIGPSIVSAPTLCTTDAPILMISGKDADGIHQYI
jgi:hypothetical protein